MNYQDVLKLFKKKNSITNKLKTTTERIEVLQKQKSILECQASAINGVSLIYKGKPILISGERYSLVGEDIDDMVRSARIYINAHNLKTWGIYVLERRRLDHIPFSSGEKWLGADYPSEKYVRSMALDFVSEGYLAIQNRIK